MALTSTSIKLVDQRDLLETLRQHPLTAPFNLALYSEKLGHAALLESIDAVCSPLVGETLCSTTCYFGFKESLSRALLLNQPVIGSCQQGAIYFIIPLPDSQDLPDCLIGGGVFKQNRAINRNKERTGVAGLDGITIESGQEPQRLSMSEAQSMIEEIFRTMPRLIDQQVHTLSLARTTQRLIAIQKLARDLVDCADSEQAVAVVREALVVLFDLPKILIVIQQPGLSMTIHSTLGLEQNAFQIDQKRLTDYITQGSGLPETLSGRELTTFFPGLKAHSAQLFPLRQDENQIGAITILDVELHSRDQAMIELLINHLATRLGTLRTAEDHRVEQQSSAQLVSMISALSLIDNRPELYRQILEMSAELLTATSGSLMLLNETDGTLKIAAVKGMTSSLANSMSVSFGEGIAGRVAKSGFPMLVNDIERDKRVAFKNRPRYKTKSFLCLPLEVEDRVVGVLNLADKANACNFTETDLNLVKSFTHHAVSMIDRAEMLEKAGQFEHLAITDPLTGLYNRRLLESRLQEELSRGERQNQSFCIILADLDNFKTYNDICGHLAGDNALRKVADLMRHCAREMDIVTRYGGEEFCVILPGTGKKESLFVGERIRRAIDVESFPGESHLPLGRLTISLGIAAFPNDGDTANELIHAADLALYRAKTLGRNRLVLYEPSQDDHARLSLHK